MIITLQEAKNYLRVDCDDDDELIQELVNALPGYLENTTGHNWDTTQINPLVKTVSRFLLWSWYEGIDNRTQKVIDNLLTVLTVDGKGIR